MRVEVAPSDIDWEHLLSMLRSSYAYMDSRIDPPSSLGHMTAFDLERKASDETLIAASVAGDLIGCVFCRPSDGWLYVGKLAVKPDQQGQGVGRLLLGEARLLALNLGLQGLELETRVELIENHEAFAKMGFVKVADQMHPGYSRVTSIRMRAPFGA